MSIKELPDGRWHVQVNRKGMPRTRRLFHSEEQAVAFEEKYILDNKPKINTDQQTLRELVDLWYELHGSLLAESEKVHRLMVATADDLGNPVARELTAESVLRYRAKRLQMVAPKTWNNQLGLLKSVYNKLLKFGSIDYECPISGIDPLKLDENLAGYLSIPEIERLLTEIQDKGKNPDTWWVTQICLRTGARWREAERLTRRQIFEGKLTFAKTKTGKLRTVPLDPVFYNQLLVHIDGAGTNQRVFRNCMKAFEHAVKRAEIVLPEGQCTHICRHTFASHFMMKGGSIFTLQKILGHVHLTMTLRYAHMAPEYLADAIRFSPLATES